MKSFSFKVTPPPPKWELRAEKDTVACTLLCLWMPTRWVEFSCHSSMDLELHWVCVSKPLTCPLLGYVT